MGQKVAMVMGVEVLILMEAGVEVDLAVELFYMRIL